MVALEAERRRQPATPQFTSPPRVCIQSAHRASQEAEGGFWPRSRHKPAMWPPRQFSLVQAGQVRDKVPSLPTGCNHSYQCVATGISSPWPAGGSAGSRR